MCPSHETCGHIYVVSSSNPARQIHHSKVFKLATWVPYSYAGDPWAALGSPGTTKEEASAWAHGRARARGNPDPAASFVVAGNPQAAHGSSAYEYGIHVANFKILLWCI